MQIAITSPSTSESRRFRTVMRWTKLKRLKIHVYVILQYAVCACKRVNINFIHANLDINGNRFEISFKRVWNRLNWWRCDIKCSFVSIAMLIWSFTNPCDLHIRLKTQTVQKLRIQEKWPDSRFECKVSMYMWTLLQIHVTATKSGVRWIQWWTGDARTSQELFAFDSCVVIGLNFLKFLFVSLKFIWWTALNMFDNKRAASTHIQYFSMSLKGVDHVRIGRQWYFRHLLVYIGQLKTKSMQQLRPFVRANTKQRKQTKAHLIQHLFNFHW